jgi:hypothetical protein
VVAWLLDRSGIDLLSTVVFAGTFSLALAFASNDLVNFIGVPLAGLSAWEAWMASGAHPDQLTMEALTDEVRGNHIVLLAAGVVMVGTLWLSSKARSVTETEVSLGRQDDGRERFRPGPVSRRIVQSFITSGEALKRLIPLPWRTGIAERFAREELGARVLDRPAFDTLRASVNLTVASILIVFATSLKLPLSTTFVSFMVAMGTALADRAWGRDAAVYRLAGVFSVVGGWFITAIAAFSIAGCFAILIRLFDGVAVVTLLTIAAFALVHTHRYHGRVARQSDGITDAARSEHPGTDPVWASFHAALEAHTVTLDRVLTLIVSRERRLARQLEKVLKAGSLATRQAEIAFANRLDQQRPEIEPWLMNRLALVACERDLQQSMQTLVELATAHVLNEHTPPSPQVDESLRRLGGIFGEALRILSGSHGNNHAGHARPTLERVPRELDDATRNILEDLYSGRISPRNAALLLGIVLELRDVCRALKEVANA